jgi:hypothetical protein
MVPGIACNFKELLLMDRIDWSEDSGIEQDWNSDAMDSLMSSKSAGE